MSHTSAASAADLASKAPRKAGTKGMPREAREQVILAIAGQVFARGDYHSASMDEIATLSAVSKPMIYTYFGSKEGLYIAYVDRTGRELLARLLGAASGEQDEGVRLRARITEFLAFVEEYRDGWTVLFRDMAASLPLAEEVATLRGRIAEAVGRMIEAVAGDQATLDPARCDAIAHAIVGAGESLANWWLAHPEVERDRVVDWFVENVRAAVAAALRGGAGDA